MQYTDALIEQFLEASGLSPEEKMDLFNRGKRRENLAACGDAKLKLFYEVCIDNNFTVALAQVEKEMQKRGILPHQSAPTLNNTPAPKKRGFGEMWVDDYLDDVILNPGCFLAVMRLEDDLNSNSCSIDDILHHYRNDPMTLIKLLFSIILFNHPGPLSGLAAGIKQALLDKGFTKEDFGRIKDKILESIEQYTEDIKTALSSQQEGLTEEITIDEAVEKHDTLNPKLWNADNTLKPEVEEKIMQMVKEFTDGLEEDGIKIQVADIVLIGSNCSYNYNEGSDLDVHIKTNTKTLDCPEQHLAKLYSAYRSLFNKKFDIDFYGIPVELYVETEDSVTVSNGIYSVLNKTWIKEPVQADIPEVDNEAVQKEVGKWTEKYNTIVADRDIDEIDTFIEQVYDLRKQAMEQGNEFSEGNLVFKELRNAGYLDNLKALKAEIKSEELSLESLQVNEELLGKEYYDTRAKLSRTANNQAQLWQDGRFSIYLVKEREVDRIIDRLNQAFELEYCTKTPGRYDFSHFDGMPGKLPDRYFTISGKIMLY